MPYWDHEKPDTRPHRADEGQEKGQVSTLVLPFFFVSFPVKTRPEPVILRPNRKVYAQNLGLSDYQWITEKNHHSTRLYETPTPT